MSITIKEYQNFVPTTFVVPPQNALAYLFSGLAGEAGEVAGNYAKYMRGDFDGEELANRTEKELGDVLYFIFQLANVMGMKVEDILEYNKAKLELRLSKNKIKGDGEDR
jgi:NTP pyrophosphatase (non-canonical NTP hydrolase)